MKTLSVFVFLSMCLCLGCQESEDNVPATSYRVKADKLVDSEDFVVWKVDVEASGERDVQVHLGEGQLLKWNCMPDRDTNIAHFDVILVAHIDERYDSTNIVKWFIQIKDGGGSTVCYDNEDEETIEIKTGNLEEVIDLKILEGISDFGEELVLGKLQKQPIVILVN
jgi:hypothetical protein